MPIYEFQCQACNHIDELLMRFSDPEPTACTVCGAPVKKLISQSTFALKGSGWYVTDYARKGATAETGTPKPLAATTETTPATAAPAAESAGSSTTAPTTTTTPTAPSTTPSSTPS